MRPIRFIHCGDLHIDTPFSGISEVNPDLAHHLNEATFQSFNNIVELAVERKVDFVLVAGDVYDSADKSLRAQLRFRDGLKKLSESKISSFIVHGNHDPLDSWSATIKWPELVTFFNSDGVQSFPIEKDGKIVARIYGISFGHRDVYDNLSKQFERKEKEVPAIALLHANVGQNTGHKSYAPASLDDLKAAGMDYWALGHVHNHCVLKDINPAIVYSGCSQARSPRERGEKGCCLVTLLPDSVCEIEFVETDVVRYVTEKVDVSNCEKIDDMLLRIRKVCEALSKRMNGRSVVVRINIVGRTPLHEEILRLGIIDDLLAEIRQFFENMSPLIWIADLDSSTHGLYDLELLRRRDDFVTDVIAIYDELENPESQYWEKVKSALNPLLADWSGSSLIIQPSTEELLELTRNARDDTLDKLVKDE